MQISVLYYQGQIISAPFQNCHQQGRLVREVLSSVHQNGVVLSGIKICVKSIGSPFEIQSGLNIIKKV